MDFNCSTKAAGDNTPCTNNAGISKFKFTTGKTHRLRLINAGSEGIQRFSIDGHNLTVIANDFVPIVSFRSPQLFAQSLTSTATIYNESRHTWNRPTSRRPGHCKRRQFQVLLVDALQHLNRLHRSQSTQRPSSNLLRPSRPNQSPHQHSLEHPRSRNLRE
jgi:hypothetical protein